MAATASAMHVRKRPFQPSITSFFNRDDNPTRNQSVTSPLSPPLPAETQASLLSVGMRVRKSVPEGYKTHKTQPAQSFPFPSTAPASTGTATIPQIRSYTSQPIKELTPFCGLHKIGGLAEQPQQYGPSSSAPARYYLDGSDDALNLPALSSSQNTIMSTQDSFLSTGSFGGGSKKRSYEDEIEDDLDAYFDVVHATEAMMDRPIAQLKSLTRRPKNERFVFVSGPDDFEEASFLAPIDGMEVDHEQF